MTKKNFYDSPYWTGAGRLLWNLRRLNSLICAITEQEPGIQAPYLLPYMHQYKRRAWLGWEATWWTMDGQYLQLQLAQDRLLIQTGVDDEENGYEPKQTLAFSNTPPAGSGRDYEPYTQVNLDGAIKIAQTWLREHRAGLQNIEYSIDRLFFGQAATNPWEQLQDVEWADQIDSPQLACIRKLLCLTQAVHQPGCETGFIAHMGYSEQDHDLRELYTIQAEWFVNNSGAASFELHKDGSLLWDSYAYPGIDRDDYEFDFSYDPASEDPAENTLNREQLHGAISSMRAWMTKHSRITEPRFRLYTEFGLDLDDTGTWVNTLPVTATV